MCAKKNKIRTPLLTIMDLIYMVSPMKKLLTLFCHVSLCCLILFSFGCANKSTNLTAHVPTAKSAEVKKDSQPTPVLAEVKQAPMRTMAKVNATPTVVATKNATKVQSSSKQPQEALVAKTTDTQKEVAVAPKTAVVRMNSVASATSTEKAVVIPKAKSALGVRYSYGGTTTRGFDCSGFVQWVYKHAGVKLPRTAREQSRAGVAVKSKQHIKVGDIVAFRHPRIGYHTGIYVGDNKFIHSPRRNKSIRVSDLSTSYFRRNYIGARRVAELSDAEKAAAEKLVAQYGGK